MNFGREKRLTLGALALLAPLPLPFNEPRPQGVIGWPFLLTYLAAVGFFLYRTYRGRQGWLRPWMLNLLGLCYLPYLFVDLFVLWPGHLVGPMMHLAMFALVTKLFSMERERDKWHATVGIFFLFLASMATSAHPAIVLYLAAFVVLSLTLLVRFALLHLAAADPQGQITPSAISMKGFLAVCALVSLLVSAPLFAFLPRLRTPYIMGRGGTTGAVYTTGFSDEVNLDVIGNIRGNREVAMRFEFEGEGPTGREMRFKGATYELYDTTRWRRTRARELLRPAVANQFVFSNQEPRDKLRVWLQPLNSRALILPVETQSLELIHGRIYHDAGGGVSLSVAPAVPLYYRVGLAASPVLTARAPRTDGDEPEPALDQAGISPRVAQLADLVAGDGTPYEQARRIEAYLLQNYEYTLDFVGRRAENPIEDFLFTYRSGHCEYFASSLVLMLRSRGIPARFVTGFLGAEYNPLEGYFILRQNNAHAWVEAHLPDRGWQILDPTPPAGRPTNQDQSLRLLLSQTYDYILFRWDRYIISYGFYDQVSILSRLRGLWARLWRSSDEKTPELAVATLPASQIEDVEPRTRPPWRLAIDPRLGFALLVLGALTFLLWWRRFPPPLDATKAYARLRRRVSRGGIEAPPGIAPLSIRNQVALRFPRAALPTSRLIQLYLRESFGNVRLSRDERGEVRALLSQALKGLSQ